VYLFVVFDEVEKGLFAFKSLSLMTYFVYNGAVASIELVVLSDTS
jgi:hypothetical protein